MVSWHCKNYQSRGKLGGVDIFSPVHETPMKSYTSTHDYLVSENPRRDEHFRSHKKKVEDPLLLIHHAMYTKGELWTLKDRKERRNAKEWDSPGLQIMSGKAFPEGGEATYYDFKFRILFYFLSYTGTSPLLSWSKLGLSYHPSSHPPGSSQQYVQYLNKILRQGL